MMGKVPDHVVAEAAGCATLTVLKYRAAHDIPAAPHSARRVNKRPARAPYFRFLGVVPDSDIAEAFSVSRQAVGFARKARGFASPATVYPLVSAAIALVDGAEVGKTRVLVPKALYDALLAATMPTPESV
jgi:hypothetical protein